MSDTTTGTKSAATYDKNLRPKALHEGSLSWYSPKDAPFQVAGLAWFAQDQLYRRFPKDAPYPLSEGVAYLVDNPAGGQIRFRTNSKHLSIRVTLRDPAGMVHMPATGQCGVDVYLGEPGEERFLRVTTYDITQSQYESVLFDLATDDMRAVTLNLPLYQCVEEILIGLDDEADILPPAPYVDNRPIIVYGTSITQGGCACRPGMAYTNILSRFLNREFLNMGFSGSGKGEPEVARTFALIPNPGCIVLDYEPNSTPESLRETLVPFIGILREAFPTVPILVLSAIRYAGELVDAGLCEARNGNREFQQQTVETLRQQGDAHLYFHDGSELLGEDFDECTVDGVHPTDLGFYRMAVALEPVLRKILP